jgi:hypothetical protein
MTEWGMQFPEEKREAAKKATKLGRFATVEVGFVCPPVTGPRRRGFPVVRLYFYNSPC